MKPSFCARSIPTSTVAVVKLVDDQLYGCAHAEVVVARPPSITCSSEWSRLAQRRADRGFPRVIHVTAGTAVALRPAER
jgi:hypothetical protein